MTTKMVTISGTDRSVKQAYRNHSRENKKTTLVSYQDFKEGEYHVWILEVTPYSSDELQENAIYGNPDHEAYLMSDEYESDCKNEQWDWLKNEMG